MAGQMGHTHARSGTSSPDSEAPVHNHRAGGFIMNLLGFDRFTKGKAVDGLARSSKASNPFDLGMWGNCKDFWTAGRELGVEYDKLYDVPMEGFREAKRRRERDEEDDGQKKSGRRSLLGLVMGGRSSRGGYEPVSQA